MKALASHLLRKVGLFQVVFDLYNTARALDLDTIRANRRIRRQVDHTDHPLPPVALATSAAGTPDLRWFLESGAAAASSIRDTLSRYGTDVADLGAVLDFGCGCGRVIRHLPALTRAALHGTDVNRRAVHWCRRNLSFAVFEISALQPPLRFADSSMDLIYSLSVFTHMPERLQQPWASEFLRILRPGGLLLASLHGPSYMNQMSDPEREAFLDGKLVVRSADAPGSNRCAAYHPPEYAISVLFNLFEVLEHQPEGAVGNPIQDLHLVRKPALKNAHE